MFKPVFGQTDIGRERFHRVFANARKDYAAAADAIFLEGGGGGLDSSAMEQLADAARKCTTAALRACLDDIGRVAGHSNRAKARLLGILIVAANEHADELAERFEFDVSLPPVQDLVAASFRKEIEQEIADFRNGWTAPARGSFKERHPHLWDILMLLTGAAVTWIVTQIVS